MYKLKTLLSLSKRTLMPVILALVLMLTAVTVVMALSPDELDAGAVNSQISDRIQEAVPAGGDVSTDSECCGAIHVKKWAFPEGPQVFSFILTGPETYEEFDLDDDPDSVLPNERIFSELPVGTYVVTEVPIEGWSTTVTCKNAQGDEEDPDNIQLDNGELVTCKYHNTKESRIIVEKQTDPAGSEQEFPFQASWLGDSSEEYDFTLIDDEQHDSGDLEPGTYSVSEIVPAGWELKSVACTSSDGDTETAENIQLDQGEIVTCVFSNQAKSRIIVEKQTDPAGSEQEFPFQASWLGDGTEEYDFTLMDDEQHDSGALEPGNYSVSELVPSGWQLKEAQCTSSDGDDETPDDISLQLGETVTCVFSNQQESKIIVEKQTDPAGSEQEFPFQSSWLGDGTEDYDFKLKDQEQHNSGALEPGAYSVNELVPAGWQLKDAACTSSNGDDETAEEISLQVGETVTCVFSNEQDSRIIVEKRTTPAGSEQKFPFQASWLGDGTEEYDFKLKDQEQHNSGPLDPDTYSVDEMVPVGWFLVDAICTSSQGDTETIENISLQAGETVTCVFNNVELEYRVTVGFEDLPEDDPTMDYDYNDWEAQVDITFTESSMEFRIDPLGRGGVLDHVFHIEIPGGTLTKNGSYTLTMYDENNDPIVVDQGEFIASQGKDFIVNPCTCEAFPPSGRVVNVIDTIPYEPTQRRTTISIVLDEPEPNMEDLFTLDVGNHGERLFFDPYLFVVASGEEIHTGDVRILTVLIARDRPDWEWPEEHVCLTNAYPLVTGNAPDFTFGEFWWRFPSTNECTYGGGLGSGSPCELDSVERECKISLQPGSNPVFLPLILR